MQINKETWFYLKINYFSSIKKKKKSLFHFVLFEKYTLRIFLTLSNIMDFDEIYQNI